MRKSTNSIQAQMKTDLVCTYTGTSSATEGGAVLHNATSALGIKNGEVEMLSSDLDAADYGKLSLSPDGNSIKLVQGTPKSNNTQTVDVWGISDPDIVKTTDIIKGGVRSITTTNYNSGSYAAHVLTATPTIVVNAEYGVIVELDGRRQEREFGKNTDKITANVSTPAVLATDGTDYVLQLLVSRLNSRSQATGASKRFVALGISIDGSGGGTAINSFVNDDSAINFLISDGITYGIQKSTELVRTFAKLIASSAVAVDSTIVVVNPLTAGASAKVDAIVVIGTDASPAAYEDDMHQVRTDVTLNPSHSFESEGTLSKVYLSEANGNGRSIVIDSRHRAQLNIHTKQLTPYGEYFSEGYTYLDKAKNYGVTRIDYVGTESTIDHEYTYEKQAIIYWEQTEAATLSVDGAEDDETAILATAPTGTKAPVVAKFITWSGVSEVVV